MALDEFSKEMYEIDCKGCTDKRCRICKIRKKWQLESWRDSRCKALIDGICSDKGKEYFKDVEVKEVEKFAHSCIQDVYRNSSYESKCYCRSSKYELGYKSYLNYIFGIERNR